MKFVKILLVLFAIVTIQVGPYYVDFAYSFTGVVKAVPQGIKFIQELANIGETKGSKYVMEALEYSAKGMSNAGRTRYIQDNLLKVLMAQNKINKVQADEWLRNLGNVPGFEKALSKMAGMSETKFFGHGFEIETANALHRSGYKILEIGKSFKDGIKQGATDIDLIASKGSKTYVFELKNYQPKNLDLINPNSGPGPKTIDVIRGDMESLKAYRSQNPESVPVFVFRNKPPNSSSMDIINAYGKTNNVKVLFGDPAVIAQNLDLM